MNHQVGPQFDGLAQVGRGEGRVYQQRQTGPVRNIGEGGDIQDFKAWVAQHFTKQQPGVGSNRALEGARVSGVDKIGGDAEAKRGRLYSSRLWVPP